MFLDYDEFLLESKTTSCLDLASKLMEKPRLKQILQDCVDGIHPKIQITPIQGTTSYVAVAMNSGVPESAVFKTSDPRKALLAMIILNTGKRDPEEIISIIGVNDVLVEYSVFPGTRKLSDEEMKARYNLTYSEFAEFLPIFTVTPIIKKF